MNRTPAEILKLLKSANQYVENAKKIIEECNKEKSSIEIVMEQIQKLADECEKSEERLDQLEVNLVSSLMNLVRKVRKIINNPKSYPVLQDRDHITYNFLPNDPLFKFWKSWTLYYNNSDTRENPSCSNIPFNNLYELHKQNSGELTIRKCEHMVADVVEFLEIQSTKLKKHSTRVQGIKNIILKLTKLASEEKPL